MHRRIPCCRCCRRIIIVRFVAAFVVFVASLRQCYGFAPVFIQQHFERRPLRQIVALSTLSESPPSESSSPLPISPSSSSIFVEQGAGDSPPSSRSTPSSKHDTTTTRANKSTTNSSNNSERHDMYVDHDEEEASNRLRSFHMDLQNLALDDPQKAQDALEVMEQLHREGKYPLATVLPDVACFNIVLEGWLEAGRVCEAERLLDSMEERLSKNANSSSSPADNAYNLSSSSSSLTPTSWSYLLVAQGWANDSPTERIGAERAEALLRRLQKRRLSQQQPPADDHHTRTLEPPSVQLWGVALDAWCKRAGYVTDAIQRARALLEEMEAAYGHENSTNVTLGGMPPPPNVLTYTSFIGGLARSKERDLARQAEAVLIRMRQHGVQPDVVAYTSVLNCWSKAVSRREREMAATRSLQILQEMERLYIREEQYHVKPSPITYATAIRAIGHSLDLNAASLAEGVLERMYHLHRTGLIANLKPTTPTFNAVIHALSTAPGDGNQKLRHARRAEEILFSMMRLSKDRLDINGGGDGSERDVEPDVRTWAAALRAWAQCTESGVAAENCQRVLDKLRSLLEMGETSVRPNFVCYTTVMGAWGSSRCLDGLDRMEEILKFMELSYEETLEADVRPNTVSYVTAIDAIVRRNEPDAALRAQATVDRMLRLYAKGLGHVRPTRTIFNCLINAYSKSPSKGAAKNAEKIFQWMETQGRHDDMVRPDGISLCGVLNAWANQATSEGAGRALQIWQRMESVSSEERGFELSIMMPNIVIKAIARTKDHKAVEKAEQILLKIERDYQEGRGQLRPDVTTASSVINAAAYYAGKPDGRRLALDIALRTFRKISNWGQEPNNITFGTLLKATSNLLPPSDPQRDSLARQLFDQCCDKGYVDGFVLSQVRQASPKLFRELVEEPCGLGGPNSDTSISSVLRNVPSEWSANVVE